MKRLIVSYTSKMLFELTTEMRKGTKEYCLKVLGNEDYAILIDNIVIFEKEEFQNWIITNKF